MPPYLAALLFSVGIVGLFLFERRSQTSTSAALWLPVIWLAIGGSRNLSFWLGGSLLTDSPDQYLEGSPLDRAILSALIGAGLFVLISRWTRTRETLRNNPALAIFVAYCLLSALWSDFPFVAVKRWTKALGNIVMVLIVLTETDVPGATLRFLSRTGFIIIPASLLMIKYFPLLGRYYDRWEGTSYYSGVATDKNLLGCICLVLGLGLLARFIREFRAPHRATLPLLALTAVLVMDAWLLFIASSATSQGCFLLGAILICALNLGGKGTRGRVHMIVGAFAAVALVAYLFPDVYGFLVGSLGRNTTLTGRTELWDDVLALDTRPWIGAGFESFFLGDRLDVLWAKYWWHPNEAHNGYLETYLSLGRIGLALLAILVVTGYRNAVRVYGVDRASGSFRIAILVIALIYNFTEAAFKVMNPVWILFLLAITSAPSSPGNEGVAITEGPVTDARTKPQGVSGWDGRTRHQDVRRRPARHGHSRPPVWGARRLGFNDPIEKVLA